MNLNQRIVALNEAAILEAELVRRAQYKIRQYFPDTGPLRRELYTGANRFFEAGQRYPERLLMGGNRVGKTDAAGYEVALHLTGQYPSWWRGRRFDHPVDVWASGDTASTTRDIQQLALYGPVPAAPRTGFIPAHLIKHASPKNSIPNAVETIYVRHASGGESSIQFKSYDQRREAFQGTSRHIIWLDEEPPEDVYTECLLRTLTCNGMVIVTFTPVEGLTPFVQQWLESAALLDGSGDVLPAESAVFANDPTADDGRPDDLPVDDSASGPPIETRQRCIVMISWDEVPHLSDAAKQQMLTSIPPYQRAARTRGIPNLGSGVIYPIPEDEIKVKPFDIPSHWPRGYGMDVGWNWTVAVWGAYDRETGTWYIYHEHYRSHAEPPVHAAGIRAAGEWVPGRIDPAANGRSQVDGRQLLQLYIDLGLRLETAPNGVEAGIYEVWTKLTAGKVKVFSSLRNWWTEYRMYRRDPKGKVIKKNDHLMDATRYLIHSGVDWVRTPSSAVPDPFAQPAGSSYSGPLGWMA